MRSREICRGHFPVSGRRLEINAETQLLTGHFSQAAVYQPLLWSLLLATISASALAQDDSRVPWNAPQAISDNLPPRQIGSPRELLAVYGIDEDQLNALADGHNVEGSEWQTLIRILFRLPQFPLHRLEAWSNGDRTLDDVAAAPRTHSGQALRVRGRVHRIATERVPGDINTGVGFNVYHQVHLETDQGTKLQVYTRTIPAAWHNAVPPAAPAQATTLFLKIGPGDEDAPLVFVASRLAWFPDQPDEAFGVTDDHVYLASLGMDFSLFDTVRERNRRSVDRDERECFYQLLAAVDRAEEDEFARRASSDFDLAPLLQQPQQHHGDLLTIVGTARRITRVVVGDEDIQQRLGINHYYQIDLFVPLGKKQVVRLGRSDNAQQSPTFANSFPVTACVRELPPGLAEGDDLRQEIRIPAVYFKLWAYRSQFVSSFDQRQLQISPLLVGRQPILIDRPPSSNRFLGEWLAVGFLIALAGSWIWLWRWQREDARFSKQTFRRRHSLPPDKSLNELGLTAQEAPDLNHLEEKP